MNIMCDIGGQYDCMMRLVSRMPDEEFVFVGDLNDRGPKSKEVIEWVMENARCVHSNHGEMFIDKYRETGMYDTVTFLKSGGQQTLQSYGVQNQADIKMKIPVEHIEWLESLPMYIDEDGVFISHAPKNPSLTLEQCCDTKVRWMDSLIWNRSSPGVMEGKFQVFGHNAGMNWYGKQGREFAVCIDTTRKGILTGIHYPSKRIYQEAF